MEKGYSELIFIPSWERKVGWWWRHWLWGGSRQQISLGSEGLLCILPRCSYQRESWWLPVASTAEQKQTKQTNKTPKKQNKQTTNGLSMKLDRLNILLLFQGSWGEFYLKNSSLQDLIHILIFRKRRVILPELVKRQLLLHIFLNYLLRKVELFWVLYEGDIRNHVSQYSPSD